MVWHFQGCNTSKLICSQMGHFHQAHLPNLKCWNQWFRSGGKNHTRQISQLGTHSDQQLISMSKTRVVLSSHSSFRGLALAGRLPSPGARFIQIYNLQILNFAGGAFPTGASAKYTNAKYFKNGTSNRNNHIAI